MNVAIFVQNIKRLCEQKGTKPTVACKESGAGKDLINQIERKGSIPSVEKVQLLANYLGVTTSELLGEEKEPATEIGSNPDLFVKFNQLTSDDQDEILAIIEMKLSKKSRG